MNNTRLHLPDLNNIERDYNLKLDMITFIKYINLLSNKDYICKITSDYINDYYLKIDFSKNTYQLPRNYKNITTCKGLFILPIIIILDKNNESHINVLIIDNKKNIVDFYEPHGIQLAAKNPIYDIFYHINNILKNSLNKKYKLINVHIECPIGLQTIQSKHYGINDSVPTCVSWSLLIIAIKINNPNTDTRDIIKYFIKLNPQELDDYIRRWITYVKKSVNNIEHVYKYQKEHSISYNDKEIENIKKLIRDGIKEYLETHQYNQLFGIPIYQTNNFMKYYNLPFFDKLFFKTINDHYQN